MQALSDQVKVLRNATKVKTKTMGGFCYPLNVTGSQDKILSGMTASWKELSEKTSLDPKHCAELA